jgi:hypothetical protein
MMIRRSGDQSDAWTASAGWGVGDWVYRWAIGELSKFVVPRANAARTLSLGIDEIHMVTRTNAKPNVTVSPVRVTAR